MSNTGKKTIVVVEDATEPFSVWLERRRGPSAVPEATMPNANEPHDVVARSDSLPVPKLLLLFAVALIASLVTSAIHVFVIPRVNEMRGWPSLFEQLHELARRSCHAVASVDASQPTTAGVMRTTLCWLHDSVWP